MALTLLIAALEPASPRHGAVDLARWARDAWGAAQADVRLEVDIVPRAYADAAAAVASRLLALRPDLFLLLDTDPSSPEWKLHVLAANYDDDPRQDAAGVVRRDHIIDSDGPVAYRARLPLDGLWDKLLVEQVPVRMSHKAGHVFNHVFYHAMRTIAQHGLPTLGGAIETPPLGAPGGRSRDQLTDETAMVLAVLVTLYPAALKETGTVASDGTP